MDRFTPAVACYSAKEFGKTVVTKAECRFIERLEYDFTDMKSHEFVPFIAEISATAPTFCRNRKWVAYLSDPQHSVWRSRSDGTERMQVTFPPMDTRFPVISPDGTKVAFHTSKN